MRRRDLLIAAGAIGAVVATPNLIRRFQDPFDFEPHPSVPGFRRLQAGSVTAVDVALIGVDTPSPEQIALRNAASRNPCAAAFGEIAGTDKVPIAVFTDYNCPFCPRGSEDIEALAKEGAPIDITWHDYPVLGARSETAARAAIAAGRQARYVAVHQNLMRSVLRPGPAALKRLASEFDLDPDRLLADMKSETITHQLERTRAAAAVFGLFGTPSFIVGQTVVIGYLEKQLMHELIQIEQKSGAIFTVCS